MAGQGKYTRYRPVDPSPPLSTGGSSPPDLGAASWKLANQLFKTDPDLTDPVKLFDRANKFLTPAIQKGDPILFPGGVYLNFQNPDPKLTAPNLPEGPFPPGGDAPGGPANAYAPNQSSPDPSGAGSVAPVEPFKRDPLEVDPHVQIGVDGLVNPLDTSKEMFEGSQLPSTLVLGSHPKK